MGKRAATALRVIAICVVLDVVRLFAIGFVRDRLLVELRDSASGYEAAFAKIKLYSEISIWSHLGLAVVVGVGLTLFAVALGAGRAIALSAVVAMLVHIGLSIANRVIEWPDEVPLTAKLMWWSSGMSVSVAYVLPLAAAHRELRSSTSRLAAIGAGALLAMDGALSAYGLAIQDYPPWLRWVEYSVAAIIAGFVAGFGFALGKSFAAGASGEAGLAKREGALDGTPLRALAWALLARIGLGILLQALIVLAMVNQKYDEVGSLTTLGTALGVLLSMVILGALVAYLRYPETHRSDALGVAMALLMLGAILDIVAANAASELFGMVAEAKRAASFWAMPSLSKIEELQTTLAWTGRGGLAIGVAAGFALASSLLATARAEGNAELVSKAQRVRTLLMVAGVGAVGVSFFMQAVRGDTIFLLLMMAIVLLGIGIFVLVDWVSLLFGLAACVERGRDAEPEDSAA